MGIFERRNEEEGDEEEAVQSPSNLSSPQGWFDKDPEWPPDAPSRYTHLFESPMVAVLHLEDAGRRLTELAGQDLSEDLQQERFRCLESYYLAVQSLQIDSWEMGNHKGTFGRLSHSFRRHLGSLPELLYYRALFSKLEFILTELDDSGDLDLVSESKLMWDCVYEARSVLPGAPPDLAPMYVRAPAQPSRNTPVSPVPRSPEVKETPPTADSSIAVETETAPAEPSTEVEGQATEPTTSNQLPTEDTPPPREEQPPEAEAADTQVSDSPAPEESAPTETAPLPSTLTAERIFRVLLEECLKDGKISQAENRAIQQIRQILQIPTERHQLIAHTVQADYKSGALRGSEDMNPLSFFEKICRIALKGSGITSPEQILLQVMATYLHITREEFQEIRIRIRDNP